MAHPSDALTPPADPFVQAATRKTGDSEQALAARELLAGALAPGTDNLRRTALARWETLDRRHKPIPWRAFLLLAAALIVLGIGLFRANAIRDLMRHAYTFERNGSFYVPDQASLNRFTKPPSMQ